MATTKKETAPKAAETVKAEETKTAAAPKAEKAPKAAKKPAAKKAAAPKAEKAAKKPAAKKAAAPKAVKDPKINLVLEYHGVQVTEEAIVKAVKAACKGTAVKTLDIYVKPEDAAAYYVANGEIQGKVSF